MPLNPKKKLANNPFDIPSYQYPADLGSIGQEPYIVFQVRDGVARNATPRGTVAMYMPADIRVAYGIDYEKQNVIIDQALGFDAAVQARMRAGDILGAAVATGELFDRGIGWGIDTLSSAGAVSYFERFKRKIINPHMGLFFKGVQPRTFNFNFQMFAKSAKDSESIQKIIHVFKYAMHPGTKENGGDLGKRWFMYPDNFLIGLFSPSDEYMFKISVCVLDKMEVDYAGSKTPSFFYETGAPVHITMSLQFSEMEIMTKERIEQGY